MAHGIPVFAAAVPDNDLHARSLEHRSRRHAALRQRLRNPLTNEALQRFHRTFAPFEYFSVVVAQELRAGVKRPRDRKALGSSAPLWRDNPAPRTRYDAYPPAQENHPALKSGSDSDVGLLQSRVEIG